MSLKVGLIVMLLVMGTFEKFALKRAKHRALFNMRHIMKVGHITAEAEQYTIANVIKTKTLGVGCCVYHHNVVYIIKISSQYLVWVKQQFLQV